MTSTIPVGEAPQGIAVGDGSVWVANSGDGTVTRIDPHTVKPVARIVVGGSPQGIAIGAGRAWVTVAAPAIPTLRAGPVGGTVRVDARFDVDYMDPALAYGSQSWQLLYATCAKLLNYPDRSGPAASQLVPEVAQTLPTQSPDGRTYTFTVRTGFRFSPPSNQPVTAQTFKATIERTLNPAMKNPVASEFDDIVGARAYMTGRADHISGVIARGSRLIVRLTAPAPDLPARLAQPFFCAVPPNTPINPDGEHVIPSAGPYMVESYTPAQGIVLVRNPNYHGTRPHRPRRIVVAVGIPGQRAVAQVQSGAADYAQDGELDSSDAPALAARYGSGSEAARRGRQEYFVTPELYIDFFVLNTHRSLFANAGLRRAVNYAVDRQALAQLGDKHSPLSEQPAEDYLAPGIPGYSDARGYPLRPDLAKARPLARGHGGATVVLYTCDVAPCDQQAQILKTDLAAIDLKLEIRSFPLGTLFAKLATPGEPFDIAYANWGADYPDPDNFLNMLLESGSIIPTLVDPTYRARLAAAAKLSGAERYLTYSKIDVQLVRNVAPLVVYDDRARHELFSARIGCQSYGIYGLDLAALCIRP